MANLVANSGCNKGQLSYLVEAICLLFLQLKELLPGLVRHQLPPGCKDFSDYYLSTKLTA